MITYINKIKILLSVLAILFGVFFVVYGEYDDSPGGQVIGLLLVIAGVVSVIKNRKKINRFTSYRSTR